MSKEIIFRNDSVQEAFEKGVAEFGVDETFLYEPRTIREVCMAVGLRYLYIQEFGEKLTFYVPSGSAEIKNYKPSMKLKKSLVNNRLFRDLELPMSLESKQRVINQMIMDADADNVDVIVRVKSLFMPGRKF